jgi:hypothetical protein
LRLRTLLRLCLASLSALSDTSTPSTRRSMSCRVEYSSCWARRGIQPVPVHRSRTRSSGGRFSALRSRPKRCVTEAAVSALFVISYTLLRVVYITYLGISTPGLQRISRSPKYSLPRRYCSGLPDALFFTNSRSNEALDNSSPRARRAFATLSTCSRNHRNSFCAAWRSRQGARRAGRKGSIACALRMRDVGMRGIAIAGARRCEGR